MILITGAHGQLGTDLRELADARGIRYRAHDYDTLDVTDREAVEKFTSDGGFEAVINSAAYTAVDRAEDEPDLAFAVNRDGAAHLAAACAAHSIPLFHVSTDYVFDGRSDRPYREDDPVAPLGVYGRSKCEGEVAIRESGADHVILRVSWLFGHGGANFVKTMRRLAREREELRVVADQHGCPTPSRAVADLLLTLATRESGGEWGTYHFTGQPATTWHQFAEQIVQACRRRGPIATEKVVAVPTSEYPTKAERPRYSVLNCGKIEGVFGVRRPGWAEAVGEMLDRDVEDGTDS